MEESFSGRSYLEVKESNERDVFRAVSWILMDCKDCVNFEDEISVRWVDCDSPSLILRIFKVLIKDFTKMPFEARALFGVNRCVVPSKICFLDISS